jgi:hypothetical protein
MLKFIAPLLLVAAIQSHAALITATVTADNAFSLYTGNADGTELTYIGRNTADWSTARTLTFDHTAGNYIYLAAWSDNLVAQGILGQFTLEDGSTLLTGTNWEAHLTNMDINNYMATMPSLSSVSSEIGEDTWAEVTNTVDNGAGPWGYISDISSNADWMWGSSLMPGSGYGEYQIFRIQVGSANVPEPGMLMMLGIGMFMFAPLVIRRKK